MIGLDTNVLVRYIAQDDPAQARRAAKLIESRCTPDDPGVVSLVVLCELVWVLHRGYGYARPLIGEVLRRILTSQELAVEQSDLAWRALRLYEAGPGDLADYIIGLIHKEHNATTTFTFDRKLGKTGLFDLVSGT